MLCFFFKQKTAYEMRISDWSSDVCSSDLRSDVRRTPVQLGTGSPKYQYPRSPERTGDSGGHGMEATQSKRRAKFQRICSLSSRQSRLARRGTDAQDRRRSDQSFKLFS